MKTVAVTGHRPEKLGGYDASARLKLDRFAASVIALSRGEADGRVHVITGMALGWDQSVARACEAARPGVEWTAAIPFVGQERMWPPASQAEYERLLAVATRRVVVCDGQYTAWKMQKRNEWMIDQCVGPEDFLVALWNGSSGGTANAVAYAQRRGVRVVNMWDTWKTFI